MKNRANNSFLLDFESFFYNQVLRIMDSCSASWQILQWSRRFHHSISSKRRRKML